MQHTPGPWYYAYGAVWTTPNGPEDGGYCLIKADRDEPRTSPCERDRNVNLAAAAPDMLKALKAIERNMDGDRFVDPIKREMYLAVVRAAIAKAEGK